VLFIAGAGYYQVAAVLSATQLSMTNLAGYGNTSGGATINSGATVSPSGTIGPAGGAGVQGPPGKDGAYSTVYAINSVQGNGGASAQLQLVNDVSQGVSPFLVYRRDGSGNNLWGAALLSAADAVSAPAAGEVSHIAGTTSGVLAIKKLKSGAAGSVVLTDQGGSSGDILVDVPVDGVTIQVTGGQLKVIRPADSIGAHIETPAVKTYTLDLSAASAYTITSFVAVTGAGSCTVSLLRNGSGISGGAGLSITTTPSTTTLSQAVSAGDKIQLQVTATSSGADLQFTMKIQK
jgi:hypothetical protein